MPEASARESHSRLPSHMQAALCGLLGIVPFRGDVSVHCDRWANHVELRRIEYLESNTQKGALRLLRRETLPLKLGKCSKEAAQGSEAEIAHGARTLPTHALA